MQLVPTLRILPTLGLLLVTLLPGRAQITISGLADKTTYTDQVTFTLTAQPGYTYDARLDNAPVPVGAPVLVNRVDYHELSVFSTNTSTAAVTSQLLRFIVASGQRNGTENGLPPWVPYPMIPSTAEEAAAAHLRLIAPRSYPTGMEIPIVAWVENQAGGPVRVNGLLTAPGHPDITIRRGAGSGFLAATNPPGTLTYAPSFLGLQTNTAILVESASTWTSVSGTQSGNLTWPENARISVTSNLTLLAGSTLTIGPGSVIRLGSSNTVIIAGRLVINGTTERPVVFAPANRTQPWGGFYLTNSTSQLDATATLFTGSGANAAAVPNSHRHEQCLFYCDNHAHLSLTDCAVLSLAGQFGHGVDRGQPWNDISIVRTLIQRCTTGGEWNGSSIQFLQSALMETPYETGTFNDGDEDGIYFTTGQYVVRDSLIGWTRDDGIDSGSGGGGTVTVSNTWIESTFHEAFAWSGGDRVTTNLHTVCLNCGQGIECGYSLNANSPNDFVSDCLSLANLTGGRYGDNYDWTYTGFLRITNSFLLYNYRDLWGRNWDDWTYRTGDMDIQGNFITVPNPNHPNNTVWDPARDGGLLATFMTTPPDASVGLGLAVRTTQFDLASVTNPVPVRLSSFTTNFVSVDYSLQAPGQSLASGTLQFAPGETVKFIALPAQSQSHDLLRLQLQNPQRAQITGQSVLWFARSPARATTVLVPAGAVWKYLDFGTNAGTAWHSPDYDDSGWPFGPAELGFGDTKDGRPETTQIHSTNITYYFRHAFVVTTPAAWSTLTVKLKRDDGGIVYLKDQEIFRSNIPDGPFDYLTRAALANDDGTSFYSTNAPASLLVAGTNVLAVEIHQESLTSSDVSFDLQLEAAPRPALAPARFGRDWLLAWPDPTAIFEQADELTGPWSVVPATSPMPIDPVAPRKFYRLRLP